jgi:hypothetical protein
MVNAVPDLSSACVKIIIGRTAWSVVRYGGGGDGDICGGDEVRRKRRRKRQIPRGEEKEDQERERSRSIIILTCPRTRNHR